MTRIHQTAPYQRALLPTRHVCPLSPGRVLPSGFFMDTDETDGKWLPSSKAEAERLEYRHYFTGKPCKNGHYTKRLTKNTVCSACHRENEQKRRNKDHKAHLERKKESYRRNREAFLKRTREYKQKNKEYLKELERQRRDKNLDHSREVSRQWKRNNPQAVRRLNSRWKAENPETNRAQSMARYAAKTNAIPPWLSHQQKMEIKEIYRACPKGCHVDHIVPLRGKNVSGLHVPWNLQYLDAAENVAKGNKHEDE